MTRNFLNIFCLTLLVLLGGSCGQNATDFGTLVKDNKPAVPVNITGTGVFTFGGNPTLESSVAAGGNVAATLSVPANSGVTITEITTIIAGNAVNAGQIRTPSFVKFNTAPIAVNATEYKFSTTFAATRLRYPTLNLTPVVFTPPAPPAYRFVSYLFLVKLSNGTEVISVPLDVRVLN